MEMAMSPRSRIRRQVGLACLVILGYPIFPLIANDTVTDVRCSELTESSGLAVSRVSPQHFWTHNDSGGEPKLFALNREGAFIGSIFLQDAEAVDWEDVATFHYGGENWIMVADIGDNAAKRKSITLYFLREPDPTQHHRRSPVFEMTVQYPDGPRDCEAVAVDTQQGQIVFVSKSFLPAASVYAMPLPSPEALGHDKTAKATLQKQGTLAIPLVSAMDIDTVNGDIVLVNYFQCFCFRREEKAVPQAWVSQLPEVTELPKLKQIEAVAITRDREVWVTSEGIPAKLAMVRTLNQKIPPVTE
jgi:hypothetical protein